MEERERMFPLLFGCNLICNEIFSPAGSMEIMNAEFLSETAAEVKEKKKVGGFVVQGPALKET